MATDTQKLRVIRSRTDRDLAILVLRELDRGRAALESAISRNSPQYSQAAQACETASALWSRITGLTESDRLRMETSLKALRSRLDRVPAYANLKSYPASFAS